MLRHYKGTTGYTALYLFLFFGVSFLTLLLSGICSALGFSESQKVAGAVIFAAFWICGFVVTLRFVFIEKRRPTISESNIIGIKSVLYIVTLIICLALIIALLGFLTSLFSSGEGADEVSKAAQGAKNAEQGQQAIGALMGVTTMMLLLYLAPFLNLAVISRLFTPNSNIA